MNSFQEEALLAINHQKFSEELSEYKVAALHFMVDKAFANPYTFYMRAKIADPDIHIPYNHGWNEIEYYGCRPAIDYKLTRAALQDFITNDIDYAKSTDPADHVGNGFAGTFVEEGESFTYLKATLFSGLGELYVFSMNWDKGFAKLIQNLGTYHDYPLNEICDYRINNMLDVYNCPVNWAWIDNQ